MKIYIIVSVGNNGVRINGVTYFFSVIGNLITISTVTMPLPTMKCGMLQTEADY